MVHDKRNDYDFDVISFPFLDGNIPKGQSYGVFISQLVRYARINCSFSRFIDYVKRLVQKLIQQDFDAAALRKRFQAFIDNHFDVWGKFGTLLSVSLKHISFHLIQLQFQASLNYFLLFSKQISLYSDGELRGYI